MFDNTGGTFRTKINPFTQVSNSALRDNDLSLKAKGLYSLIQSYITIPNFTLYKGHLMSLCKEKEKAFDSAWKELKDNGYLKQYRIPKGKNDTFVYEYDLLDVADLTTPSLINLNKNGEEIKNHNKSGEEIKNHNKNAGNSHTPHLVPYANSTPCQEYHVPTVPCAKRGGNNNTDSNNTDKNNIGFNNTDLEENLKSVCNISYPIISNRFDGSEQQKEKTDKIRYDKTSIQSVEIQEEQKKEKTDKIRCDKTSIQSVEIQEGQKNKESFQNATADQSNTHLGKPSNTRYSVPEVEEIIKKNIDYDDILVDYPDYKEMLDGVLHVVVSTIVTDFSGGVIQMKDEAVPAELVRSVFFKLNRDEVEYFIENFNRQTDPAVKLTPYIRTSLYRNHGTNNFYWKNRVNVDMPELAEKKIHSKRK